jgi:hypothetical protein
VVLLNLQIIIGFYILESSVTLQFDLAILLRTFRCPAPNDNHCYLAVQFTMRVSDEGFSRDASLNYISIFSQIKTFNNVCTTCRTVVRFGVII